MEIKNTALNQFSGLNNYSEQITQKSDPEKQIFLITSADELLSFQVNSNSNFQLSHDLVEKIVQKGIENLPCHLLQNLFYSIADQIDTDNNVQFFELTQEKSPFRDEATYFAERKRLQQFLLQYFEKNKKSIIEIVNQSLTHLQLNQNTFLTELVFGVLRCTSIYFFEEPQALFEEVTKKV